MTGPVSRSEVAYVRRSMLPLVGAVLRDVVIGDAGFPALFFRNDRTGEEWWVDVQSDAEGNDPGFLMVEAIPAPPVERPK